MPNLNPEEQDLANALLLITQKHGKFNADNTGVWAGYDSAEKNAENAKIGVKCGNCVFWQAPNGCQIITHETEEGGLCRFAVLPDGAVDPSKATKEAEMSVEEHDENIEVMSSGPCWEGYVQVGMKEKDGKMVPNCVPAAEAAALLSTAGSKPAPKKDQIKGSDKNKKGSADTGKGVDFTEAIISALEKKVKEHNEKAPAGRKVTLAKLKAVYRRGAGAFSTSHRPDQNRNSWAMGRVNAFLHLVKSGKPSNPKYTTDNDLLPKGHPRSSIKSSAAMTAAAFAERDLYIELKDESEYADPEEALLAFAEYSGLGYESIPAFRAAWRRGVNSAESPFDRAANLAINLYDSEDADLLPTPEED